MEELIILLGMIAGLCAFFAISGAIVYVVELFYNVDRHLASEREYWQAVERRRFKHKMRLKSYIRNVENG